MSDTEKTPPSKKKTRSSGGLKMDISDEHDHVEQPTFGPAALGLHRVGTALPPKPQAEKPVQMLNARGMPARIRKKNKLFFDDDIINDNKSLRASLSPRKKSQPNSPAKTPTSLVKKLRGSSRRGETESPGASPKSASKQTPTKRRDYSAEKASKETPVVLPAPILTQTRHRKTSAEKKVSGKLAAAKAIIPADKKLGQQIGLRLRNLLKLPKAHKWVTYEWFYSFVDKPLFDGDNDFQACLKEVFPRLKTRMLTRAEWSYVRSKMGKPRRCCQRFFDEERKELERKRQKIRLLQNKQSSDINFVKDLPSEIPLPLPVGTKVTARLRTPQDGIFAGIVDAVDSMTSTYRVTFERTGLGTQSIPDYEIIANDFSETISVASLIQKPPSRVMNSPIRMRLNKSDPLLGQDIVGTGKFRNPVTDQECIGGFPVKLLEIVVRLKKTLMIKQSKLQRLRDMNADAEIQKTRGLSYTEDFQRRYASIVISMEKLNKDMKDYLNQVQQFAQELCPDPNLMAMLAPTFLREKCREAADEAVTRNNPNIVNDENIIALINKLATILLVGSHLYSENSPNAEVLQVFEGCIEEVKNHLNTENVEVFKKSVQVHLHHIRLGLGQLALMHEQQNKTVTNSSSTMLNTTTTAGPSRLIAGGDGFIDEGASIF